jgi:S-formylglutathione hydrolase FrmB
LRDVNAMRRRGVNSRRPATARSVARRRHQLRRRRLFAGAAAIAVVIVAVAVLALTVLAGPDTHGARLVRYSIDSRLVGRPLPQVGVVPAGQAHGRRPLLVFLHGKGGEEESNLNSQLFAALARLGSRAPDIVFPNGGEDSYWHDRANGKWGSYVIHEVIPQALRRLNADPGRVAIGGISMGGFGAYDVARLDPGRFCAVGGHSAALWRSGGETAAGAFDSAEDFSRHDVIGAAEASNPYPGKSLWLDVGTEDPFRSADTELAHDLREKGDAVHFHVWPGAHEGGYWRSHWNDYLGFYASALARCRA